MAKHKVVAEEQELELEEVVAGAGEQHESGTASEFYEKNKLYILAIGVVVVGVLGYFIWNSMNAGKNKEAAAAGYQAVYYWEKDSLQKALKGDGTVEGLESIINQYGGTAEGNMAKYRAGIAALKEGRTEEGIQYLKSFSKGDNLVSASAYMALGFAHEDLGKSLEAAEYFEKGANVTSEKDDAIRPMMLKLAGEAYEEAGKKEKAVDLYKQIKDKYPNSQEGQSIDKYLGRAES